MTPDLLSAFLRGLSFVALAQAAGGMIFLLMFGAVLGPSRHRIERTARVSALAALVLLPAQFALEAARMAGNLAGVLDTGLQAFALSTSLAHVLAARMIGVVLLLLALTGSRPWTRLAGASAVLLLAGSFALTGHTAADDQRWLLAPLLVLHVLVVSFWFGALRPLIHVTAGEPASVSAQVVARFSRIAGWMVPGIRENRATTCAETDAGSPAVTWISGRSTRTRTTRQVHAGPAVRGANAGRRQPCGQ